MPKQNLPPITRWSVLILCALTIIVVYTVPALLLPVLFAEIAADLDLDFLQLGIVWGSVSLSSLIIGLVGGALSDRWGSRFSLVVFCALIALLGALRGFATSYFTLVASMLLFGLVAPALPAVLHKTGAYLFSNHRSISTVTISTGFALSLFLGSRYTATWLSPAVGGWRNVLFLFGGLSLLFALIWMSVPSRYLSPPIAQNEPFFPSLFKAVKHVLSVREVWTIGFASLLYWGCLRGFIGYTPLYLRELGWEAASADNALSLFFLASLIFAIPSTYLSDRFGLRRLLLIGASGLAGVGIALLGTNNSTLIFIGVLAAGGLFDSYMANHQAALLDLKGISVYTGSALGVILMFREIGGFLSPPIGNWLAQFGLGIPFYFWGSLGVLAAIVYLFLPNQNQLKEKASKQSSQ